MLTEEQQAVVSHKAGHAIVGAVAGSGKTHTMVARVIHLLARGEDPRRILVLMFNKPAQEDFQARLARDTSEQTVTPPPVLTFHAFGLRLIDSMQRADLLPGAELLTQEWQVLKLAKAALGAANTRLPDDERIAIDNDTLVELMDMVGTIKANLYDPDKPADAMALARYSRGYIEAFRHFEALRVQQGVRTFDDLIYDPVRAMLADPALAQWAANRYSHIILDEYQDINEAQQALVRIIAGTRAQVMAVGDEDQCIYTWRGSRPEYMISKFQEDFPGATRYLLSRTFRHGHRITLIASQIVANNTQRTPKLSIAADDTPNTDVHLLPYKDEIGTSLADYIKEWVDKGHALRDAAILVREYSQTVPIETALLKHNIPYALVGAKRFHDRPEVLSLRGHLQLAAGGLGEIEDLDGRMDMLRAMLTIPSLYLRADKRDMLVEHIASHPDKAADILLSAAQAESTGYQSRRLSDTALRWRRLAKRSSALPAGQLLSDVINDLDLYAHFKKAHPRPEVAKERQRMCEELVNHATGSGQSVSEFLASLAALSHGNEDEAGDRILLTSGHRSKGLEFDCVILPNLVEGRMPLTSDDDSEDIEEERRLFYVMATRARLQLALQVPQADTAFFRALRRWTTPAEKPKRPLVSRFLYEANLSGSHKLGDDLHTGASIRRTAGEPAYPPLVEDYLRAMGHPQALPDPKNFSVRKDTAPPPFEMDLL